MAITPSKKPALRFNGYTDEWKLVCFGDIFERVTRRNKENNQNILTISAQQGLVSQDKFFTKIVAARDVSNYYLLHKDDFAYNKSYSTGYPMGAIKRLIHDDRGVVSTLYICFKTLDHRSISFYEQYFETGKLNAEIEMIAQEGARNHGLLNMSVGDFFNLSMMVPSVPEQEKISEFLSIIDEKIDHSQSKIDLFNSYRKGVIQTLFSGTVRFKDANGNMYPDWRKKKIGDILHERKTYLTKGGALEHISLTVGGVVPKSARYERDFLVKSGSDKSYKITKLNDICYNPANLKFGVIARNKYGDGIFSPIYITFEISKDEDANFVEYLVTRNEFIQRARRYEEGTVYERMAVKPSDLINIEVSLPSLEEQRKISKYLDSLGELISIEEQKLDKIKKYKKALLQQMFV